MKKTLILALKAGAVFSIALTVAAGAVFAGVVDDKKGGETKASCGQGIAPASAELAGATCQMFAPAALTPAAGGCAFSKAAKSGCADMTAGACGAKAAQAKRDVVAVAAENPDLRVFLLAAQAAGLTDLLRTESPITVFAPTNAAFDGLDGQTFASLLNDSEQLRQVLMSHVVAANVCAETASACAAKADCADKAKCADKAECAAKADCPGKAAACAGKINCVTGASLAINKKEGCGTLTVNEATVLRSDLVADNGRIHVIDRVLLPQTTTEEVAATPEASVEEPVQVSNLSAR